MVFKWAWEMSTNTVRIKKADRNSWKSELYWWNGASWPLFRWRHCWCQSVMSCGWRWVDDDVPWFVVTISTVTATNIYPCGHKSSAVLSFAFLSAPGHSFTSEDTVTSDTMSFKDILTLSYLGLGVFPAEQVDLSCCASLAWRQGSPFPNRTCAGHAGWWQIHNFIF